MHMVEITQGREAILYLKILARWLSPIHVYPDSGAYLGKPCRREGRWQSNLAHRPSQLCRPDLEKGNLFDAGHFAQNTLYSAIFRNDRGALIVISHTVCRNANGKCAHPSRRVVIITWPTCSRFSIRGNWDMRVCSI